AAVVGLGGGVRRLRGRVADLALEPAEEEGRALLGGEPVGLGLLRDPDEGPDRGHEGHLRTLRAALTRSLTASLAPGLERRARGLLRGSLLREAPSLRRALATLAAVLRVLDLQVQDAV